MSIVTALIMLNNEKINDWELTFTKSDSAVYENKQHLY